MVDKAKISNGRVAVDSYRAAHAQLYAGGWHKGISEAHTPLLEKLVDALEKEGFVSAHTGFESRGSEILAWFWNDSDELNIIELGFKDKADFEARASLADRETLEGMWK